MVARKSLKGTRVFKHIGRARDIAQSLKAIRTEAKKEVRIAVISNPQAEAKLLEKLQVDGDNPVVFGISGVADRKEKEARLKEADLALVVISPDRTDGDLERMVEQARLAKHKLVMVTGQEINEWLVENLADVFRVSGEDVVFIRLADDVAVSSLLVPRMLRKIEGKEIALAAAVPIFKEEVAQHIISQTAKQNALIGAAFFIPGADMPVLTANQIKMMLRLAAVYNQELSAKRLYEILAVVGGGFAFREAARQAVSVIPVAGWVLKGGIAYGGTIAVGQLTKKYLERVSVREKGEVVESLASDREVTGESREAESVYKQ